MITGCAEALLCDFTTSTQWDSQSARDNTISFSILNSHYMKKMKDFKSWKCNCSNRPISRLSKPCANCDNNKPPHSVMSVCITSCHRGFWTAPSHSTARLHTSESYFKNVAKQAPNKVEEKQPRPQSESEQGIIRALINTLQHRLRHYLKSEKTKGTEHSRSLMRGKAWEQFLKTVQNPRPLYRE